MLGFLGDVLFYLVAIVGVTGAVAALAYAFGWIETFTVTEATATAFQLLGRFKYMAMEYKDHHFDRNGVIVSDYDDSDPKNRVVTHGPNSTGTPWAILRLGGLIIYVAGLIKPTRYLDRSADDGFGRDERVFLHDIQRELALVKAKTKPGEAIPLDIRLVFTMRIVDPYHYLFVAPQDAIEQTVQKVDAVFRSLVVTLNADEVQGLKSNGVGLREKIQESDSSVQVLDDLRKDWGIDVMLDSMAIKDVDYQEADQKAKEARAIQKLQASGDAQELLGSMLANVAVRYGLANTEDSAEAARQELQKTADGRKLLDEMLAQANQTVLQRKMSQVGGYKKYDLSGLEALVTLVASLLGQRLPSPPVPATPPTP